MDGGGAPGRCSAIPGYLAQFEISPLLAGGAVPHFDSNSQTHWLVHVRNLCPKFEGYILTFEP